MRLGYFVGSYWSAPFCPFDSHQPHPEVAQGVAMKSTARMAIALVVFLAGSLSSSVVARQQNSDQSGPIARLSDIYCTGFISEVAPHIDLQIVGAEKENLKQTFAQGDVVFLNRGRGAGVQPGSVYYVIRPVGEVNYPFT